jgi:zinc protease
VGSQSLTHLHQTSRFELFTRKWRALSSLALAAVSLLFLATAAAAHVRLPFSPIRECTLQNGLHVVMVEEGETPVADVQVWYHVGSKDEPPGMAGFAHLFEHLMFDGTANIPPGEFSNYIVRYGGIDNAYTTEDATVFWETVPTSDLPVALWLEADRMRHLRITRTVLDREKQVVEEERGSRFGNDPYGDVVATLYAHAFTISPYRHMVIGSSEDVARANLGDVRTFYDTYYVPANATVVIAGKFDENQAQDLIQRYFGPLRDTGRAIPRRYRQEPLQGAERTVRLERSVALPAFVEGYHVPADGTPDSYPLKLAAKILSDGESSWLMSGLVYGKQMAMQADCVASLEEQAGLFMISVVMNPGHTPGQGEEVVTTMLNQLKAGEISTRDLARAKNEALRDFVLSRQSARACADALGYDSVILKYPGLYNTEINRLLEVTAAEIQHVARKYFMPANQTVVEVYPAGGKQVTGNR